MESVKYKMNVGMNMLPHIDITTLNHTNNECLKRILKFEVFIL